MPERVFDPAIHQDIEHLQGFKFRTDIIVARVEELKLRPSAALKSFCEARGISKITNGVIAIFIGLPESTFKKILSGEILDPRCSTAYLLCRGLEIELHMIVTVYHQPSAPKTCNPSECESKLLAIITEKERRIAELEEQYRDADGRLVNLRTMMLDSGTKCGEAAAKAETLQRVIDEKERHIAWLDRHIKSRNKTIWTLVSAIAVLLLADICFNSIGWLRFGLF